MRRRKLMLRQISIKLMSRGRRWRRRRRSLRAACSMRARSDRPRARSGLHGSCPMGMLQLAQLLRLQDDGGESMVPVPPEMPDEALPTKRVGKMSYTIVSPHNPSRIEVNLRTQAGFGMCPIDIRVILHARADACRGAQHAAFQTNLRTVVCMLCSAMCEQAFYLKRDFRNKPLPKPNVNWKKQGGIAAAWEHVKGIVGWHTAV